MKKFLTIFIMAFVCIAVNAQTSYKSYCQVKATADGKYTVVFDSSIDNSGHGHGEYILTDKDGKPIISFTQVAAINHLAKLGWTVVSSTVCQSGNGLSFTFFYLLEKTATSDYEMRQGIYTKQK